MLHKTRSRKEPCPKKRPVNIEFLRAAAFNRLALENCVHARDRSGTNYENPRNPAFSKSARSKIRSHSTWFRFGHDGRLLAIATRTYQAGGVGVDQVPDQRIIVCIYPKAWKWTFYRYKLVIHHSAAFSSECGALLKGFRHYMMASSILLHVSPFIVRKSVYVPVRPKVAVAGRVAWRWPSLRLPAPRCPVPGRTPFPPAPTTGPVARPAR